MSKLTDPPMDYLIKQPYFDYQTAVWARCGYCNINYYLGQNDDTIDMSYAMRQGFLLVFIDLEYAEWWLHNRHIPNCWEMKKKYENNKKAEKEEKRV